MKQTEVFASSNRSWKENVVASYNITISGSVLEAREQRIGGAIYRQTVDWTHESFSRARRPMEFAVKGEGGDMLTLRYDLVNTVLHLSLEVRHEYLDAFFASFRLEAVERKEVDTLKEMLAAQEVRLQESAKLLEEMKQAVAASSAARTACMSVSSQIACASQQIVQWNGDAPAIVAPSHYQLSDDKRVVTVLVAGLYQVHVRLGGSNAANTQFLALVVNGQDYAKCLQSDASNHQNTAQIFELIPLNVNSTVHVRCGCHSNSLADTKGTRFSFLFLG